MYESDLKMYRSDNGIGYQATHGGFVKQADYKCDAERPIEGPVHVSYKLPFVEQIWDASMKVVKKFHQSIGHFFALFGTTEYNKNMFPFLQDYEDVKEFLTMLNVYIPKQGYDGAGDYGSDEMSDIDDEINAMNEESGDGSGLVGSKEGYN